MTSGPPVSDTSPEALAVQLEGWRRKTPRERLSSVLAMTRRVRRMAFAAIRRRHPAYTEDAVRLKFVELTYGIHLALNLPVSSGGATRLSETDDLIVALAPVVAALNALEIRHFVGGSVASSFHGATRTTMDVDVICELEESNVPQFVAALQNGEYYLSESAILQAVRRQSCFNLIHLATSFKVDVFVSRQRPFDTLAMRRASLHTLGEQVTVEVPIASAEDVIISKLEWYRLTSETSDRQWDDVSRLLQLLGDEADRDYLTKAAESVGVADLLERLLELLE